MSAPFKLDGGKLRWHLLPSEPLEEIVKVLEFGARKYAANAWRDGIAWTRIIDAVDRHLALWKQCQDTDAESGLSHLAHAACNLVFLLEYAKTHPELDNRWRPADPKRNKKLHDTLDGPCMCGEFHGEKKEAA